MAEKVVMMCGFCMKQFGLEGNFKKAAEKGIRFSHGLCPRHFIYQLTSAGINQQAADAALKASQQKNPHIPLDLDEHPELVKQYKNDIFTPEEYRQSVKEMLQKRAGIIHS
jgi:hypothetical protein